MTGQNKFSSNYKWHYKRFGIFFYLNQTHNIFDEAKTDSRFSSRHVHKHPAYATAFNFEGLCFISLKRLHVGDKVILEIPSIKQHRVFKGDGIVCWSNLYACMDENYKKDLFQISVRLLSFNGQKIDNSLYFSESYQDFWNPFLETVLGRKSIFS